MALVLADRVQETTTSTGTGTITLAGAATGYQSFSTAIGNGNTTYYTISGGSEWEVGIGTYTSAGNTLSRDTVLSSSAGGTTKVTFSAGTKNVFVTYPAEKAISYDASDNVGIGNTNPAYKLEVTAISTGGNAIGIRGRSSDNIGTLNFSSNDGATSYGKIQGRSTDLRLEATSSNTMTFYTNVTERMRIDSSGNVGIGITTPDVRLRVAAASPTNGIIETVSATGSTGAQINFGQSSVADWVIGQPAGVNAFAFWVNRNISASGTELMRLDASGNLGLGVTPSAWVLSGYEAFEIGALGNALFSGPNDAWLTTNAYYNGGWKYASTQAAAAYNQNAGTHSWRIASSGTVGTAITFTQAMTLDASGQLGVGTTSPRNPGAGYKGITLDGSTSGFLDLNTNGTRIFTLFGSTNDVVLSNPTATGTMGFYTNNTERMRINSSGNVGIGTTSPTSYVKLTVAGGLQVSGAIGSTTASAGGVISNESPITRCYVGDGTGYSWAFSKRSSSTTTDLVTILDSGNVGIGTSSPGARVHSYISGSANLLKLERAENNGVYARWTRPNKSYILALDINNNGGNDFTLYDETAGASRVTVDNTGNVGIGTSSPGVLLDVFSAAGPIIKSRSTTVSTTLRGFEIQTGSDVHASFKAEPSSGELRITSGFSAWGGYQTFHTNGTERMRIDSSGNVLVGTSTAVTSNGTNLNIYGASASNLSLQNATTGTGNGNGFQLIQDGVITYVYNRENGAMIFATNNTERFRIAENGAWGLTGTNYGTSGQVLTSNGSGSAPTWQTPAMTQARATALSMILGF